MSKAIGETPFICPTLREVMASGAKGDFARALLAIYDGANARNLANALRRADEDNRDQVLAALVEAICRPRLQHTLRKQYPGLFRLNERLPDPYSFDLRGKKPCEDETTSDADS